MALSVGTNTGALMAQAAASSVNKSMEASMERLATGKRINSAADDAAGVAIASRLTSEIRGTNQAIRNAMDGQALIDTAEGAHSEVEAILQRMREVAVQASNDTNNANDRANLQLEMTQLTTEIDRISSTTTWAGQQLMDGSGTFSFQVGSKTTSADSISTSMSAMSSSGLGIASGNAATAITGVTGTSGTGAVVTVGAGETSASITHNGQTFSTGINTISAGVEEGVSSAAILTEFQGNKLVIDAGAVVTDVANVAIGDVLQLTINGTKLTQSVAAATATGVEVAVDALLDKAVTTFAFASGAVADTTIDIGGRDLAAVDTDDGRVQMTIDDEDMASDLAAQLNANTSFSADFSASASSSTGAVTVTAKASAPTVSTTAVTLGTGATNTAIAVTGNDISVTAQTGTATSTAKSTFTLSIGGTDVAFDSFADGDQKGFVVTTQNGLTEAIIQKLEDANIGNTTFTNEGSGVIAVTNGGSVSVSSSANAQKAISAIDDAIQTVNNQRATLGAVSNRLDSTVSNLTNISSNLSAGRGRIEDADFAAETTNLAKTQILQQASTAMLAQANASKQGVLSLLQG
jgi:flagellin